MRYIQAIGIGYLFSVAAQANNFSPFILVCDPAEQNDHYGRYLVEAEIHSNEKDIAKLEVLTVEDAAMTSVMPPRETLGVGRFARVVSGTLPRFEGSWKGGSMKAELTYAWTERSGDVYTGVLTLDGGCQFRVTCRTR